MSNRLIGNYKTVREIGRGGMGVVYLGERNDGTFEKPVAIKVSRSEVDDRDIKRSLVREGWILSNLDHENICRFVDMGVTLEGDVFLIMEYVEGLPIDRFCNERGLTVAKRLSLFRQVCQAVDYAHRKLIVHLDLKPSNILVTNDGVIKLFDFGAAISLDNGGASIGGDGARADFLTLEYASPELIRGKNISTLSDQYSLGVILYELLTGRKPFRVTDNIAAEIYRIICEEVPPTPSRIIRESADVLVKDGRRIVITQDQICRVRGTELPVLEKTLKGDLDQVLLTALRKEPERRYQSVDSFEQDLGRYLEKRPLIAQKDSFKYRLSKFIKRRPFETLSISFFAWTIIVSTAMYFSSLGNTDILLSKYLKYCQVSSRYLRAVKAAAIELGGVDDGKIDPSLVEALKTAESGDCR